MSGTLAAAVTKLHFEDGGRVKVVPKDNDLLLLSVNEAIDACHAYTKQLRFKQQFDLLLDKLGGWIQARRDRIADAYLTVREAGLLFLIVTSTPAYDEQLENDLTELDLQIANDSECDLIHLSVLAIPLCTPEAVKSFLSRKMPLRYVLDGDGR